MSAENGKARVLSIAECERLADVVDRATRALPESRTIKLLKHIIRAAEPRDVPTLAEVALALEEVRAILDEARPIDLEDGGTSDG